MQPLVGELDESAGQQSGNSGRRNVRCRHVSVSTRVNVNLLSSGERTYVDLGIPSSSPPPRPPGASAHDAEVSAVTPQLQKWADPVELAPERMAGDV